MELWETTVSLTQLSPVTALSKNDLSQCPEQFTAYNTPTTANGDANAHYIVGNHYQWNAATAGTGGSIMERQATSSICPKGWGLPESNSTAVGSFGGRLMLIRLAPTLLS